MINIPTLNNIDTKNLMLRRMEHKDIKDLFEMRRDPRMHEFTDTKPEETPMETEKYVDRMNKGIDDNKWIIWAIEHKRAQKVIGSISIWNLNEEEKSGELGYGILPEYQSRGLMKEALLRVVDFGFHIMKLRYLEAYTEEENLKSIKLLDSCNFIEVNRVDDEGYVKDRIYHMIVYKIEKK
jgi:[ribosomal protein S5]-alanine N-acetyltransferase